MMNKHSIVNIYVCNDNTVKTEIKQSVADYLCDLLNLSIDDAGLQEAIRILDSRTTIFENICLKSMVIPAIEIPTTLIMVTEMKEANSLFLTAMYTIFYVGKTKENDSIFYHNDGKDTAIFYRIINDEYWRHTY